MLSDVMSRPTEEGFLRAVIPEIIGRALLAPPLPSARVPPSRIPKTDESRA